MIRPEKTAAGLLQPVMLLSVLYPWISFLFKVTVIKPPNLIDLLVIFIIAIIFLYTGKRKNLRRFYRLLLYSAGLIFTVFLILPGYFNLNIREVISSGLMEWFFPDKAFEGITAAFLLYLFIGIIWRSAYGLINKKLSKERAIIRFDLGLAFFLLLLLVKGIFVYKGAALPADNSTAGGFLLFIITGLFYLGFTGMNQEGNKRYSNYAKSAFVISGFIFFIIFFVSAVFSFFSPELKQAAETVSALAGRASVPAENTFLFFIRFFMNSPYRRNIITEGMSDGTPSVSVPAEASGSFNETVFYIFAGLLILFFIMAAASVLFLIFKKLIAWLLEKPLDRTGGRSFASGCKEILSLIADILTGFIEKMISVISGRIKINPAKRYYRKLLLWGKLKGQRHYASETPREYALRLGRKFPRFKNEIWYIVNLHDEFVYGNILPEKDQVIKGRHSLRRLNSLLKMFKI